jgi:hypothetical protein
MSEASSTSPNALFADRMRREGRYNDFKSRMDAYMQEHGVRWGQAVKKVMGEFGYISPKDERQKAAQWEADCLVHGLKERKGRKAFDEEIRLDSIELIIAQLPPTALPSVEMDWIRSNIALVRRALNPAQETVKIFPEDLKGCPSRAAAIMLINSADDPGDFFKQVLSEHKKKTEGGVVEGAKAESPADMEELRRQLEEIKGR